MWEILKTIEGQIYRIIGAIIILLIGLTLGLIAKKFLKKILGEIELDRIIKRLGKELSLEERLSSLAAYLIYVITLLIVLNQLGITSIVIYIILGAILLLIGATFLLGVKDFIPNLVGGIAIYKKGYKTGKEIKVNGIEGKIERLGLVEMEIKTAKGDKIYVPNSLLIKSKVWLKK